MISLVPVLPIIRRVHDAQPALKVSDMFTDVVLSQNRIVSCGLAAYADRGTIVRMRSEASNKLTLLFAGYMKPSPFRMYFGVLL